METFIPQRVKDDYEIKLERKRVRERLTVPDLVEWYIDAKQTLDFQEQVLKAQGAIDPSRDRVISFSEVRLSILEATVSRARFLRLDYKQRLALDLVDPLEENHKVALCVWPLFRNKVKKGERRRYHKAEIPELLAEHFAREWSLEFYKIIRGQATAILKSRIESIK